MTDMLEELPWYRKIEVLRTIKGWSQEEAAKRCFTNQKAFWSWEKGQAFPRKISRRTIAQVFGVTEKDIFGEL